MTMTTLFKPTFFSFFDAATQHVIFITFIKLFESMHCLTLFLTGQILLRFYQSVVVMRLDLPQILRMGI